MTTAIASFLLGILITSAVWITVPIDRNKVFEIIKQRIKECEKSIPRNKNCDYKVIVFVKEKK